MTNEQLPALKSITAAFEKRLNSEYSFHKVELRRIDRIELFLYLMDEPDKIGWSAMEMQRLIDYMRNYLNEFCY